MAPMVELLLIRHGETAWNAERRMQGHLDIGLNTTGLAQAEALGAALRTEALDAIHTSDLLRATQTAAALCADRALPLQRDAALRERCFGIFEGLLYAELAASHPEPYRAWQARELDARYPPGTNTAETLREFSARCLAAINRIASAAAVAGQRRVALVTHGGVLECAYRAATRTALGAERDFAILNASVNRLAWTAQGLQILEWADVRHLQAAARDEIDG